VPLVRCRVPPSVLFVSFCRLVSVTTVSPYARSAAVRSLVGLLALACGVAAPAPAWPQASPSAARPVVHAERLYEGERVVLDGHLDEAVWARALPAAGFLQMEPAEGQPASESTEVRVAFDRDRLYLGVMLHDSEPRGIIAYQRQRDAGLGSDDRFMWILDTFLDGRSGYFFEINPAGLMGDGLLRQSSGSNVNKSWNGIWEARVVRTSLGWSAEIALPFRTLNFDPKLAEWGINFQRTVRRKNEESLWSGHRRNEGLTSPIHAGRLTGLGGLSQGLGLEARPYVAASAGSGSPPRAFGPADLGVDLSYSLTPSLRALLTVNTDFAETDVDARQVNLTRFPISFPEQRQFFLEGSGAYQFSPASGVNPFFSRRVGLSGGRPVPILFGARLGGQSGPYEIGLMQVRTGEDAGLPGEDFTAGRVRRNLLTQSTVGLIYTRRATRALDDAASVPDRHTFGADLDLFTSRFMGNKNLQFEGFYVVHTDGAPASASTLSDRTARGFRLNYPNDTWRMHVSWREFGEAWDPAVGFAPRRGFRRLQPTVTWAPRPSWQAVRQLRFSTEFQHLTDLQGRLETQTLDFTPISVELESGDGFAVRWSSTREWLHAPFTIYPSVVVPEGDYTFEAVTLGFETARRRRVWGGGELRRGDFWAGRRRSVSTQLGVRPVPGVNLWGEWERQAVELPTGAFDTTLVRVNSAWHGSPWWSLSGSLQYDDLSGLLGLYSRLRWIVRPGSDVYLVYTQDWLQQGPSWVTRLTGATTKVNYTHRF
jgi:hypothetical protein